MTSEQPSLRRVNVTLSIAVTTDRDHWELADGYARTFADMLNQPDARPPDWPETTVAVVDAEIDHE